MSETIVAQTDPRAGYLERRSEFDAAIARVLTRGRYIHDEEVRAFESEFAGFADVRHGVAVANGTDALTLALRAVGVKRGEGVVTVSHTAVATVAAIELAGATPILADIGRSDFCMDPESLAAVLAKPPCPIKAIVPVHLYGHSAKMDQILDIAGRFGIAVVEDSSQAHGATWRGRHVGGLGKVGAFSLYPTKNLGAFGDGGILITEDEATAAQLRSLREYGWQERHISAQPGMNSRLDEIQAAVLRVKLKYLAGDNERRRRIARLYDEGLSDLPLERPEEQDGCEHVYHQYVVLTPRRDSVRTGLDHAGVTTALHYPLPVHLQPGYKGRLPISPSGLRVTEEIVSMLLSLPIYPQLDDGMIDKTVKALRSVLSN